MTDLERLDEALGHWERIGIPTDVASLYAAARAYRLVANGGKPDYPEPWELRQKYDTLGTLIHDIKSVIDAAVGGRLLVSGGERVEWCETHKSELDREEPERGRCDWADGRSGCRIVSRLLVDPPKEESADG